MKPSFQYGFNYMNEEKSDSGAKKAKYIASIIYLLLLTFIVGGSYINQQNTPENKNTKVNQLNRDL